MFERKIPDGERLIFGVAGTDAALVFVEQLAQAGGHLTAARAWRRHDDHRPGGLDVVVFSIAVVADNQRDVGRIVGDGIVTVDPNAKLCQLAGELIG